uniref:Nuclear pore protein n=1 Tax=Romanomermis culicivorax TaxID=13658 RepID=A0A915IQH1_ROMCU
MPIIPALKIPDTKAGQYFPSAGLMPKTSLSMWQVRFAETVNNYIERKASGGLGIKLIDLFSKTVENEISEKFKDLWQQVRYMVDCDVSLRSKSIRQSQKFKVSSIIHALKYLEKQFVRHLQMVVYGNLEQGKLGGVPGMLNLVTAYLNIKLPLGYSGQEDGLFQNHPVWSVIYHCLRAGDFNAARNICSGYESESVVEFGQAIGELLSSNSNKLTGDMETKFHLLWRTVGRSSLDPYKKAAFCVISLCDSISDHSEIADKFEDWLWIRLRQCLLTECVGENVTPSCTTIKTFGLLDSRVKFPLERLQRQIVLDYGEKHFASGDSPMLYWTALWLSGQFEAAMDYLFRQQEVTRHPESDAYDCHAVHIALALHENGLLLTPVDPNAKILTLEGSDSPLSYRLNLARMLISYVSTFQQSDTRDALNYIYFLKSFQTIDGENLCFVAIRDILLETKEHSLLLGRIDAKGSKLRGLLDETKYNINVDELVRYIALDAEKRNSVEIAVAMFDLAEDHTKVLKLLADCLCEVANQKSLPNSKRERYLTLATSIATRYRDSGHKSDEATAITFFQLMDITTFFDLFHENDYGSALDVMRRIRLLPLTVDEVDTFVKQFYMVPDEVRRILPDILLICMCILSAQHKEIRGDRSLFASSAIIDESAKSIQQVAKALVQYAALIPYRMPGDTAARLVQMETFIH